MNFVARMLFTQQIYSASLFLRLSQILNGRYCQNKMLPKVWGVVGKDVEGDWTYWGGVYRKKGSNLLHTITDLKFHLN